MARRGKNWSEENVDLMLTQVEKVLPLGASGWERVETAYNRASGGHPYRDIAAIRLKFTTLKNTRKPTGDPSCPPAVVRAKRVQRMIDLSASVASLDDDTSDPVADTSTDNTMAGEARVVADRIVLSPIEVNGVARDSDTHEREQPSAPATPSAAVPPVETVSTTALTLTTSTPTASMPVEKPNRVGMTNSELAQLGKRFARDESINGNADKSYTSQKRQSIDGLIRSAQQSEFSDMDVMSLFVLMDEREAARQAARDEREEKRRDEANERERQWTLTLDERRRGEEEERSQREQRMQQVHMAMLARILGGAKDKQ